MTLPKVTFIIGPVVLKEAIYKDENSAILVDLDLFCIYFVLAIIVYMS